MDHETARRIDHDAARAAQDAFEREHMQHRPRFLDRLEGAIAKAMSQPAQGGLAPTPVTRAAPFPPAHAQPRPVQANPMPPPPSDFENAVREELYTLGCMLIEKNSRYGNSALDPIRVFSNAPPIAQILVRIDDKLSRVKAGFCGMDEDTVQDLIGYLVLLRLAARGHTG
jgi:hypothetical protein